MKDNKSTCKTQETDYYKKLLKRRCEIDDISLKPRFENIEDLVVISIKNHLKEGVDLDCLKIMNLIYQSVSSFNIKYTQNLILYPVGLSPFILRYRLIEKKSLVGYISMKYEEIFIREVEIVKTEDKEWIQELDLDDSNIKDDFVIIDKGQEKSFHLANEAKFTFVDVNHDLERPVEDEETYTTSMRYEFKKHLDNMDNYKKIPYFIELHDDEVVSIIEGYQYAIN